MEKACSMTETAAAEQKRTQSTPGAAPAVSPARHWASLNENTFVFGIRILFWVYRVSGRLAFRLCLYPVVLYYRVTNAQAAQASKDYLQQLQMTHNTFGRDVGWTDSMRHFMAFADTILDKLLAVTGAIDPEAVRVDGEGEQMLKAQLATGRGAVIVTGHVGCVELCRLSGGRHKGVRLNVLVHTQHAERFNRVLQSLNPHNEIHLIQVTEVNPATAIMLSERVERGEIVAMAGDRVPVVSGAQRQAQATVPVMFLGREAQLPIGPYVLASLFKCPLFAIACVKERDANGKQSYVLRVDRLAESVTVSRKNRTEAFAVQAQSFAKWMESVLARSPLSWFNFFPFWQQGV
jgi:predicted LPLAT superfamily acyltransferase